MCENQKQNRNRFSFLLEQEQEVLLKSKEAAQHQLIN